MKLLYNQRGSGLVTSTNAEVILQFRQLLSIIFAEVRGILC